MLAGSVDRRYHTVESRGPAQEGVNADEEPVGTAGAFSLREQLDFARYLKKRAADPGYTFREHLRDISGAIEE